MKPGAALLIVATALLSATAARAENLPDPTRPPEALEAASGSGAPPTPTGLTSIIRRDKGKPAAIINGEVVVLGGKVGDARLVKIGEDSVTLKSAAGTEILKLMPGVEKKPPQAAAAAPGKKAKQ